MNKHSGFILIIVLVFLQIFSLIGLFNITLVTNGLKSTHHLSQGYYFRLRTREFMQNLEHQIRPECVIPITPATQLAKKLPSFWQLNACHANVDGIRYYYSMEWLGDDACASSRYYRITVKASHYMLQSTIALPATIEQACEGKTHIVQPGRQGLREI